MDAKPQSKKPGEIAGRLLERLLMPIVATAASFFAGYAAKKVRAFVEESQGAGDVAQDLVGRARSAVSANGEPPRRLSPAELERRRQGRERGRRERRESTT